MVSGGHRIRWQDHGGPDGPSDIEGEKGATPWVLFDNEKDPYQMKNLVDDPASAGILKELDAMVDRWRKRLREA